MSDERFIEKLRERYTPRPLSDVRWNEMESTLVDRQVPASRPRFGLIAAASAVASATAAVALAVWTVRPPTATDAPSAAKRARETSADPARLEWERQILFPHELVASHSDHDDALSEQLRALSSLAEFL